jgi:hypothetical protein
MPPAGSEPAVPQSERPQTYALDGVATGIDNMIYYRRKFFIISNDFYVSLDYILVSWQAQAT